MEKDEILLKEYEMCQSYTNYLGTQYWVGLNIFITLNMALLGGVTYSIIQSDATLPESTRWLILALGVVAIIFSLLMRGLYLRNWFITQLNFSRMREIEDDLGMEKNWRIHGLDLFYGNNEEFGKLSEERRRWIREIRQSKNYQPMRRWHFFILSVFPKKRQKEQQSWICKICQKYQAIKWLHSLMCVVFPKKGQYVFPKNWITEWFYFLVIVLWIALIVMSFLMFDC